MKIQLVYDLSGGFGQPQNPTSGLAVMGHQLSAALTHMGYIVTGSHYGDLRQIVEDEKAFNPDIVLMIGHARSEHYRVPTFAKKVIYSVAETPVANTIPCDSLIVASEFAKSMFSQESTVIPIGINTSFFKPSDVRPVNKSPTILTQTVDIKFVHKKGEIELAKALGIVKNAGVDFRWVFRYKVADPGALSELNYEIGKAGIRDKTFIDRSITLREKMSTLYNLADLNCVPLRFNSYEMSYLEAGACGIPSIGGAHPICKELINDEIDGFLPKLGSKKEGRDENGIYDMYLTDYDDLAAKLIVILTDKDMRKVMGEAAREKAVKDYNWLDWGRKVGKYLEEVAG